MKTKLLFCVLITALFASCSTVKYIPVEGKTETVVNYIDSVRVKDSVVVVPIERIVDIVAQYDTLYLETSLAKSTAYVDTTFHALRGSIENKEQIIYRNRWKDRIVEKTDSVYIEKPVPYEVEVVKTVTPKWAKWTLIITLFALFYIGYKIVQKLKGFTIF